MPILVRPVREQLEHDRVIRFLQARWRRRYEVAVNAGDERVHAIRIGSTVLFPDLLLSSPGRGRSLQLLVEVETAESVNHLEALAEWAHLAKARAPLHLYVPAQAVEMARRLCADHEIGVAEIWSYHTVGDQTRFTLVHRLKAVRPATARPAAAGAAKARAPRRKSAPKAAKRSRTARPRTPARAANRGSRAHKRK